MPCVDSARSHLTLWPPTLLAYCDPLGHLACPESRSHARELNLRYVIHCLTTVCVTAGAPVGDRSTSRQQAAHA